MIYILKSLKQKQVNVREVEAMEVPHTWRCLVSCVNMLLSSVKTTYKLQLLICFNQPIAEFNKKNVHLEFQTQSSVLYVCLSQA